MPGTGHMKIGANIDRMVAENERFHTANEYCSRKLKDAQTAHWHTGKYRELKIPTQQMKAR